MRFSMSMSQPSSEALFDLCLREKYVFSGSPLFVAVYVHDALHAPEASRIIKQELRRDPYITRERIMEFLESIIEDFILDEDQRVSSVKCVGCRPRSLCRDNVQSAERRATRVRLAVAKFTGTRL